MRAEQRRRELAKEERQRIEEHRRRGAEELERLRLLKLKCGSLLASSLMSKGTTDAGPTCLCGYPLASCSMAGGPQTRQSQVCARPALRSWHAVSFST